MTETLGVCSIVIVYNDRLEKKISLIILLRDRVKISTLYWNL
jgi:hypothetical protein